MSFKSVLITVALLALAALSVAGPLDQKQIGPVRIIEKATVLAAPANAVPPCAPDERGSRPTLDDGHLVLSQGFETTISGFLPPGWTTADLDNGFCTQWARSSVFEVFDYGQQNSHTGARCALIHYNDGASPNDDWLITPRLTAGTPLTLHYWASAQDPSYPENWEVRVSTTGTNIADFSNLVETVSAAGALWNRHSVDLTAFAGQSFYIAWHYNAADRYVFKLDDIEVEAGSPGPTGSISGIVRQDRSPNLPRAIEDATVRLDETGVTVLSRADGSYTFTYVAAGTYNLTVTHPLFNTVNLTNKTVNVGEVTDSVDALLFRAPLDTVDFIYQAGIVDISDFDTSHATINVPNNVSVYDINVAVNIAHTWVGDLDIFLRSPGGEMVRLYRQNINISGDDFVATIFDDDTTQLLSQGEPPYTGGFRPYQALANFDGDPAQGQWTLLVYDGVAEDFGAIITWEMRLIFRTAGPLGAENPRSVPGQFSFAGNYPNPFNPSTTFEFALEQAALVDLSIFNILGEHVATVVHEHYSAGTQRVDFDGSQLSSGVFFAKLTTPEHSVTRKIVLLK